MELNNFYRLHSLFTAQELHSALRRIGRDDLVHKLLRGDLDSDSLRLIDQSTFNLRGSQTLNSRGELDKSREFC